MGVDAGGAITHEYRLACRVEDAFDTYADRIGECGSTEANVAVREKLRDWPVMLDRFATLAGGAR